MRVLSPHRTLALKTKIRTNWAMALARGNADVILSNLRFLHGGAADEDRYSHFSDQHSCERTRMDTKNTEIVIDLELY